MPFLTANGLSLHYLIEGEGDPMLWIQGLGADASAWVGQVAYFRRSFRCITFDNRDVGQSSTVERPYHVAEMAEDVASLLRSLVNVPTHVVGLSMGGSIAQELALRHPDLVRSLILVSSLAATDARLRHILSVWPVLYAEIGQTDFYRQALPWLFSHRFFERPRAVPAMLRYIGSHPQAPEAFARQAAAGIDHDALNRLPTIRSRTLIVSGEEDILVPLRLSRELAAVIPGASQTVIPMSGHSVNVEQMEVFNQIVGDFLEEVASR